MAEYLDNPAGRFKWWIERIQAAPKRDGAVSEALASVLGVDHGTVHGRVETIRLAARLADLAVDIRDEAALLPEHVEADVFLEDFAQFDTVFDHMTLARQTRLVDMLASVDAAAHRSLDVLSRQLHRYRPEPTLNEDVRTSLIAAIKNLREQVAADTTLDHEARDFILTRFGEVERVLHDASITGTEPVEVVTDSIIGSIQRQPKMWQRIAESAFAEAVGGVVVGLFLTLVSPPTPEALPPGTPEPMIINYVQVYDHLPEGGVTPEIIEGVVVPPKDGPKGLPPAANEELDAEPPEPE